MKKLFSKLPVMQGDRLTLRPLELSDANSLKEMTESEEVYRYLPTFLFEKKYNDTEYVIKHLYDECLEDSLILGVFFGEDFCGLAEMYAYRPLLKKISVGIRLVQKYWGSGVASETLELMTEYIFNETNIELVGASTMTKNKAAGNVLKRHGFMRIAHGVFENWGFEKRVAADVWVKTSVAHQIKSRASDK